MYNTEKYRLYLFFFLAFAVSSSKNILIYNEETLVALSFFCFVFFIINYFGQTIKDSLQERSLVIREELQNFLLLKSNTLGDLLHRHQKISGLLKAMGVLNAFTKKEFSILNSNGEKALKNLFSIRICKELQTLELSKGHVQQKLQSRLSEKIIYNVLHTLKSTGPHTSKHGAIQNKAIKNALHSLVENAQKKVK